MSVLVVLAVALGGFVGAPCRFALDRYVADRSGSDLPLGTFVINVSGSLLLGVLTGLELHGHLPHLLSALLATGFCGAFTTFSTWSFESVRLLEGGEYRNATLNSLGGLVVGLGAAGIGLACGLAL